MENEKYNGGPGIYSEEDFLMVKKNNKVYLIIMLSIVLVEIILFVQKFFNAWLPILILIIAFFVVWNLLGKVNKKCKEMSLEDAMYRTFSDEFQIESVQYQKYVTNRDFIVEGREEIGLSELESEKYGEGVFNKKSRFVLPKLRVVGSYHNVPFAFNQYTIYELEEKTHLTKENEYTESYGLAQDMLCAATKSQFQGSVDIQGKLGGKLGKFLGYNDIKVEDIEFNNMFDVSTTSQLGAFRLLTPPHIIRFKDIYNGMKTKRVKHPDLHMLFKDGKFFTKKYSNKEVTIGSNSTNKIKDISKFKKECAYIINDIKYYIEVLDLENEDYTMGQ